MTKLFEYLETEIAPFDERPFSPVDSAALSQACMLDVGGIVPGPPGTGLLARAVARLRRLSAGPVRFPDVVRAAGRDGMFTGLVPESIRRCLFLLAANPRFNELELRDYESVTDEAAHTQFAALAFTWRGAFSYIGFRGTDASLTGWRENLDMTYRDTVPAQRLARAYVDRVAPLLPGRLHIGGHSKGGNLALFAALTCSDEVRARIERVWCHDAPGFRRGRFTAADCERLAGRIHRTVPQDSIVGMLLEYPGETRTVVSDARGIEQHSVFTWEIENGDFRYRDAVNDPSRFLHEVTSAWLDGMDAARTEQVVEALFAAIEAGGIRDASELFGGNRDALRVLREAARHLNPAQRDVLFAAFGELTNIVIRRFGQDVARRLPWM